MYELQILFILIKSPKGIFFFITIGWFEDVNKYEKVLVFFTNKENFKVFVRLSNSIFKSKKETDVPLITLILRLGKKDSKNILSKSFYRTITV